MDRTWRSCEPGPSRAVANEEASHLGQLLLYMLGAQAKRLQVVRRQPKLKVTPLLGLFIDNLQVCLNPRRACAARVTVRTWSVRPSVCLSVCYHVLCHHVQQTVKIAAPTGSALHCLHF